MYGAFSATHPNLEVKKKFLIFFRPVHSRTLILAHSKLKPSKVLILTHPMSHQCHLPSPKMLEMA
jgi:hypothetical protein